MTAIESESYSFLITNLTVSLTSQKTEETLQVPTNDLPELMSLFEKVMMVDRRRAFRVPLGEDRLSVTLTKGGRSSKYSACDISLIGVGLRNNASVDLEAEDEVDVSFVCDGNQVNIAGLIRNAGEKIIGIEFPSCCRSEDMTPPAQLRRSVAVLEMEFIRERRNRQ